MSCADKIKDKSGFGGESGQQEKNRAEMEACVGKCGEEMLKVLPNFSQKMKDWFNRGYYLQ